MQIISWVCIHTNLRRHTETHAEEHIYIYKRPEQNIYCGAVKFLLLYTTSEQGGFLCAERADEGLGVTMKRSPLYGYTIEIILGLSISRFPSYFRESTKNY